MGLGKQHSFKWAGHIVVRFPNPLASWQLGNLTNAYVEIMLGGQPGNLLVGLAAEDETVLAPHKV